MGGPEHILADAPLIAAELEQEEGKGPWILGLAAELARLDIGVSIEHAQRRWREGDVPIMEIAKKRLGKRARHLQEWRRGHQVYWLSEILNVQGDRPRRSMLDSLATLATTDAQAWQAAQEAFVATTANDYGLGAPFADAWAGAAPPGPSCPGARGPRWTATASRA